MDSFGRKLLGYSILGAGYGILLLKGVYDELGDQLISKTLSFDDYSWIPYALNSLTGFAGLELIVSDGKQKYGELGDAGVAGVVLNPVIGAAGYYFGRTVTRTLKDLL